MEHDRELDLAILRALEVLLSSQQRVETYMTVTLDQSITDLQAAVAGVASRLGPSVAALQTALAAAQAADATDQASLQAALADAATAAGNVEKAVSDLNSVAPVPAPAPAPTA